MTELPDRGRDAVPEAVIDLFSQRLLGATTGLHPMPALRVK